MQNTGAPLTLSLVLDDELRALERAATDTVGRLRYAEVLARLGRIEEAVVVLSNELADPEARRAIARLPREPIPIEERPRKLWEARAETVGQSLLHVGPFACVVGLLNDVHVFTTQDGVLRGKLSRHEILGVVGCVIIASPRGDKLPKVCGLDAMTQRALWSLATAPCQSEVHHGRTVSLTTLQGLELMEYDLHDPDVLPTSPCPVDTPPRVRHDGAKEIEVGSLRYLVAGTRVEARRGGDVAWSVDAGAAIAQIAATGRRLIAQTSASLICFGP